MNKKEQYGIVILITAILLFQIWVADAESQRNKDNILSKNPQVLLVMTKIMNNDDLKKQVNFEVTKEAEPMIEYHNKESDNAANGANTIKPKKNNSDYVWYKPWTWFGV